MDRDTSLTADRFVAAFRSRSRLYAQIVGTAAVIATTVALLLPAWYRSQSTLLPPEETAGTGFGMLAGMIQSSALANIGLESSNTPSDVFGEILRSRRLSESAIQRFDYMKLYRRKGMDRTLKEFQKHLNVKVNAAGVLTVSFEDRSAQRSADVTNFLVAELDRFNMDTFQTRGKRLRVFLDGRVGEVHRQLRLAEEKLLAYEREHRVVSGAESEKVSGVSDILVQKFNLETQRAYVSSYSSPGSMELREIERQLDALNSEIGKLPEVKMEGARLTLDVEVQRKLLVLMTTQYEDARMQETRDTPTITVLDVAAPPQLKSRPARLLIVAAASVAALLGCAAWTAAALTRDS